MKSKFMKKALAFMLTLIMVMSVMPVQVLAAEGGEVALVAEGAPRALSDSKIGVAVSKTSSAGDFSYEADGNKITVFADSKTLSQAKVAVTLTNKKSASVVLAFAYTLSAQSDKASLSGAVSGASGVYRATLAAGASITINVDTGANNNDAYFYIENISSKEIGSGAANINFVYNTAYGSVSGAGTAGQKVTVTATAKAGSKFLAWTDENGMILSKNPSFLYLAYGNDTLKALFTNANGEAYFEAGNFIHSDLNKAAAAATKVILAADGILAAGDYTIPAGVTLLIPKDTAYTVNTTMPDRIDKEAYPPVTPTAFRTLKMAEGASITVNGAISVAGTQHAGGSNDEVMGGVYGPVGFIRMDTGSKITVNNGAFLYAWGYIVGSGEVEVLSGGTVYESFQITDWRGGTATTALALDDYNHVFPMTQYYVQNVEVPMKLNAGAFEKGYSCTTINPVSLLGVKGTEVPFIGSGNSNLFTIDSGYIIKDYDENTDRQVYKVYGNLSMKKIKVSMNVTVLSTVTLDSSQYVLPITNNLTVEVFSGTINITQDICFLPGSEIIIHEGATCNLADGKSVYVYDLDNWGNYVGALNSSFLPLPFAPGRLPGVNRVLTDAKIQVDGTINASSGYLYTTLGGAIVTSTGNGRVIMKSGTATETYQITQGGDKGTNTYPVAIPVVVAKLQNKDGTTTNPAKEINPAQGTIYTYSDGKWVAKCRNNACVANGTATCANPLPCIYCGLMLGHSYTTTVKEPVKCLTAGKYAYTCSCGYSYEETIPATGHRITTDKAVPPTCTEAGKTEGAHCMLCNEVFVAQKDIPATGHHTTVTDSAVPPTCTEPGLTEGSHCSVCNFVIEAQETVPAKNHDYKAFVTNPTCTNKGYTTHICNNCGDSYTDAEVPTISHSYTAHITTPATHLTEGVITFTCICGDAYTETIVKVTEHNYKEIIIAPTCSEQGFTAHICECGDYYADNYVPATSHSYTSEVTTPATHLTEGLMTFSCTCGDTYTEAIERIYEHSHKHVVIAPTCTEQGFTAHICECGDAYTDSYTEKAKHTDADNDGFCDNCNELLGAENNGNNCSHMCHKSGILGFFWEIINFFQKLFGIKPVCECGAAHY